MSEVTKNSEKNIQLTSKDYENLLDKYKFNAQELSPGNIVNGKIIKITSTFVLVDIGFKLEGMIPLEDFEEVGSLNTIHLGSEVEAMLEKSNTKDGYLILSRKKAIELKALNNLEKAYLYHKWIIGKVTGKLKNGYSVNVGIDTFLPDSHADTHTVNDPDKLLGNRYKFKVIKFDRKSQNAVLSRKLYLQDEREKRKTRIFSQLIQGKRVKGQVKSLTNFGAFVDLGGVEGLLHVSDMSWGKVNHPSEFFHVGQEVEVVILDFNEKEERISLGYKQLSSDPWENIAEKYHAGQTTKGKVVSLTDFGAFVELEPGVEGLVHISDLTWSRKLIHPKKLLSTGEEVTVNILDVNPPAKRISLGIKQVTPHPLELLKQKYSPGSKVKGIITNVTDFGAFMEIEKEIEGLIHISDISWKKIKHPSEKLQVGQETEAIILNIDVQQQKLSLGIKQLEGDIWEDFFIRHKVGDILNVTVVRLVNFGVFVEITPGIEGVVFLSELDEKKIENPAEVFSPGDTKLAKIIKLNPRENKISLSFRQAQVEMQKLEYQKFLQNQNGKLTLGDIMKDQFKKIEVPKNKKRKKEDKKEEKDDKS